MSRRTALLGAHVSTAGGVHRAPQRGKAIGATAIQIFTKTPNQWREPDITPEIPEAFREALAETRIEVVVSHDSYLINLASPDPALRKKSEDSFIRELQRCRELGVSYVVTHPGNYIDDREAGLARNAAGYSRCLTSVEGPSILIETTAGSGTALGSRFEELAALREGVLRSLRHRVGFCADTCHLYAAGYDIVNRWDEVWQEWDAMIGLEHLFCMHLNDSKNPFASHRDRHELIGEGTLGPKPFRRIMTDPRFDSTIKIIETPKGDDPVRTDSKMLRRLRGYASRKPGQRS